jgi:hypothetical protein
VLISGIPHLSDAPSWIITNASLTSQVSECSGLPIIVIHNEEDYEQWAANATLAAMTVAGPVVITW